MVWGHAVFWNNKTHNVDARNKLQNINNLSFPTARQKDHYPKLTMPVSIYI